MAWAIGEGGDGGEIEVIPGFSQLSFSHTVPHGRRCCLVVIPERTTRLLMSQCPMSPGPKANARNARICGASSYQREPLDLPRVEVARTDHGQTGSAEAWVPRAVPTTPTPPGPGPQFKTGAKGPRCCCCCWLQVNVWSGISQNPRVPFGSPLGVPLPLRDDFDHHETPAPMGPRSPGSPVSTRPSRTRNNGHQVSPET